MSPRELADAAVAELRARWPGTPDAPVFVSLVGVSTIEVRFGKYGRTWLTVWPYAGGRILPACWVCDAWHRGENAEAEHNTVVGAAEAGLRALAVAVRSRADAIESKIAAYAAPTEGGAQ